MSKSENYFVRPCFVRTARGHKKQDGYEVYFQGVAFDWAPTVAEAWKIVRDSEEHDRAELRSAASAYHAS